ncbi:MAG TPA: DUF3662 and FHA domain-containing protein [Chloroflexota bacterium]|nr:DUF3662 and FHA domain-containing protein [Chloroflexota bacterium]
MNPVAKFENFVERLMERTFTRVSRSELQPVEIGKRLVRAMESEQSVGVEGVLVPNVFDVYLSTPDYQHFQPMRRSLAEKLEAHVARIARQRRYGMVSRPLVTFREDAKLDRGDVIVRAGLQDVEAPEAEPQHTAVLPAVDMDLGMPARPAPPVLAHDGKTHAVLRSPTTIGRMPDNDIVFDDRRVSRHHARILQQGGRWVLQDAGSTNGTAVNGKVVREAPLRPGDTISLGGFEVTWEQ